jgi:serine phosphatase RsbU (regulator of sigma subunit)
MNILENFAETLSEKENEILHHVRGYIEWRVDQAGNFVPSVRDDVDLRTYLLHLKTSGVNRKDQREQIASLRRFYEWANAVGLLTGNPFDEFGVERPTLTREQIRRRKEIFSGSTEEREIARLRTLNQLAEQLNRSSDTETALVVALETLVSLMGLKTAWAFRIPSVDNPLQSTSVSQKRNFVLASACGLPPGLERDGRYYLSKPEYCHCQDLLTAGHLKRAVNIVECTRLLQSAQADGDNQGLLFHASVPIIAGGEPLGIINVATQEWQFLTGADLHLLSAIGSQVAIALERARLFDLTHTQRLRLEAELQMARDVQASLLPEVLPEIPGYSLAAEWRSAREMAGDFYDIFALPNGRWGIVVADVADKGAAAAMFMAMTSSLIRASSRSYPSPAATLREVNQRIMTHSTSNMFVTVFYAILDATTGALVYANAGHNPPFLRGVTGSIKSLTRTGPAIGLLEEPTLVDVSLTLSSGDALTIYTDGITDALNPQGEEYGLARLSAAVRSAPASNAALQLAHLSEDLAAFAQDVVPFDDITFFILVVEVEK